VTPVLGLFHLSTFPATGRIGRMLPGLGIFTTIATTMRDPSQRLCQWIFPHKPGFSIRE
jgi:hypothetical protein